MEIITVAATIVAVILTIAAVILLFFCCLDDTEVVTEVIEEIDIDTNLPSSNNKVCFFFQTL